jgi:hypothetical protein
MFDFGLIRAGEQLSPLKLSLYSTLERGIEIDSVNTGKQHGFFLQFETRPPISIKPGFRGQPGTVHMAIWEKNGHIFLHLFGTIRRKNIVLHTLCPPRDE